MVNTFIHQITRVLVSSLLLCISAVASAEKNPQLQTHEVQIVEEIKTPRNSFGELEAIDLHLSALGRDIHIALTPSRFNRLSALPGINTEQLPALYEGVIKGEANSWARISITEGKLSGSLFHTGKLFQLDTKVVDTTANNTQNASVEYKTVLTEPAASSDATPMLRSLNFPAASKDPIDKEQFAPTYELSDDAAFHPSYKTIDQKQIQKRSIFSRSMVGTNVTRAMRIGIAVDSRFNEAYQGRGLARALSIINSVDAIYQAQLGIAIIVENVRVYEDAATDPLRNSLSSVDEVLSNFRNVRNNDSNLPSDLTLVHLFSGHQDPNRVIGLGWISTACRLDGYDLSMSTPYPFDTLLAAHEIAHNLGALHDDNPQCLVTNSKQSKTLMWPELSSNSTSEFSMCSTQDMQKSLDASCNVDNIDVGVRIRTVPSDVMSKRSVIVDVANKDILNRTTDVYSVTQFPIGTRIENVSAGCRVSNRTVTCNHGTIQAQSLDSAYMSATLLNRSQEKVTTELEQLNAYDVDTNDNRAVLQLLSFDDKTGDAVAGQSTVLGNTNLYQENDAIVSTGGVSILSLAGLLLLLVRAFPAFYKSRFTE